MAANHVRRVTAANGHNFSIVIARRTSLPTVSVSCLAAARKELIGLLVGKPRALRTAVLRIDAELREQRETAEEQAAGGPRDGVVLFTRNEGGGGGGGGGSDVEYFFKAHGNFISSGGSGGSTLHGLVPDGVAQITLEYPKRVSRGRRFKSTVYPSAFRRTVRVQQNVISLRVPRGAGDAFPRAWSSATARGGRPHRPPGMTVTGGGTLAAVGPGRSPSVGVTGSRLALGSPGPRGAAAGSWRRWLRNTADTHLSHKAWHSAGRASFNARVPVRPLGDPRPVAWMVSRAPSRREPPRYPSHRGTREIVAGTARR